MRRPLPEGLPGDHRPIGYQCFGCGRHFIPKGIPKPVRKAAWQWRECLCDDPACPANDIIKALRK